MSNTTIAQKLQLALNNKSEIKSSLIAKGINVGDKMSEWSEAIDNASMEGVEPIRATFAGSNSPIKIMYSSNWYNYGISKMLANGQEVNTTTLPANLNGYDVEYYTLKLPNETFYECRDLTSVTIGNSVTSIGDSAFRGCWTLTSVTIGNSVTSIGQYAFSNCDGLTSVTIPNSVTSIGSSAFSDCNGLTSVTIPNSVTSIGDGAFQNCSSLTSLKVEEGNPKYDSRNNCNAIIESSTNTLIAGCKTTTIPYGVTSIGNYAFRYCSGLISITIPNSVTSIGYQAFYYCWALTSVTIPNSVTSIGEYAFSKCSGLTSVTIPNSVTYIEPDAFSYCSGLTSITIPNSVTSIGDWAFYDCSGLTSVTIPNSVTSIESSAFYRCSGLVAIYSDGLQAELDVSGSQQLFDAESIQSVIDTWQEGGAIRFSQESALDLKGILIIGEKAHWDGNTLVYGKGGGGYYYYDDGQPVDLNLPSGTLWAKCNLGAEKETDFGLFFQWGDTQGYEDASEHQFNWNDYKWGTESSLTKYNSTDGKLGLDNEDDPVYKATLGQYKSPTKDQLQELIDNTEHRWTSINDVNGMKFWKNGTEEPTDDDSYIFIPAAGNCYDGRHSVVGSYGYVWSNSRHNLQIDCAWYMCFDAGNVNVYYNNRCSGFSVRGVVPNNT